MRYLVISACIDARTDKEFEPGDEFLPEPDAVQAERLVKAGCLRVIPDNAPALPGSDDTAQVISDLRAKVAQTAIDAGTQVSALNTRLSDLTAQHDSLTAEYQTVRTQLDTATGDLVKARADGDQAKARVTELEAQIAARATPPANDGAAADDETAAAAKPARPTR